MMLVDPGFLKTVSNTIVLNRSRAAGRRSTFIRRIAPSQDANRNSASSVASNCESTSPADWAAAMHVANGVRHFWKIALSRLRKRLLWELASRLKSPIRHPTAQPSRSSLPVMMSRYCFSRWRGVRVSSFSALPPIPASNRSSDRALPRRTPLWNENDWWTNLAEHQRPRRYHARSLLDNRIET